MKRVLSLAIAATLVAGLSGCSAGSGLVAGSTITIGMISAPSSLNTDQAASVASENINSELAHLTTAGFYSTGTGSEVVENPNFGSVTVTKTKPFTVKYLVSEAAKWSDGEQITAADLMLSWAAATNYGGVKFKSLRLGNGLANTNGVPSVGDNGRSLTVEFNRPVGDYKTALTVPVAAHALAKIAFAGEKLDATQANARVLSGIQDKNKSELSKLAKAYRTAYQLKATFTLNPDLAVTSGAYQVSAATADLITLKANSQNAAVSGARAETIKIAFYSSALQMIAALKAGKLDLASLTPSASESSTSIVDALKAAKSAGVSSLLVGTNTIEATVINQGTGSSFAASTFGSPTDKKTIAKALIARQSFLNLISTSKIQTLVGASQPVQDAKSFVFTPDSSYYQSSIQDSGVLAYQFADDEKAYNALKDFTHRVQVRVLFDSNSPTAQIEYSTLAEKADKVGFTMSNVSSPDPQSVLDSGAYDVYLGPQQVLSGAGVDLEQALSPFTSDQSSTDASIIDGLGQFAHSADTVSRAAALKKIDAELIATAYGLPLYQLPSIIASSKKFVKAPSLVGGSSLTAGYATWNLAG